MYEVSPFGERRADLREGFNTANIMSMKAEEMDDEGFQEMIHNLCDYLVCDKPQDEQVANLPALARMKRKQ